jgi:hypothetical protein
MAVRAMLFDCRSHVTGPTRSPGADIPHAT